MIGGPALAGHAVAVKGTAAPAVEWAAASVAWVVISAARWECTCYKLQLVQSLSTLQGCHLFL